MARFDDISLAILKKCLISLNISFIRPKIVNPGLFDMNFPVKRGEHNALVLMWCQSIWSPSMKLCLWWCPKHCTENMMTSWNGNIFCITGHLRGKFTGPGEFPAQRPVMRSFDIFFGLRLNKWLSKQSWGWWFETLSHPLWRHCNETANNTIPTFPFKLLAYFIISYKQWCTWRCKCFRYNHFPVRYIINVLSSYVCDLGE